MHRVGIVGLGLIGGSLGLALRQNVPGVEVIGVARRHETADEAVRIGAADRAGTAPAALAEADLVVLACPLAATASVLEEVAPHLAEGARVTDVGSVKGSVVAHAATVLDSARNPFMGGHPMAGREVTGISNADGDLFRGRPWVFTPSAGWFPSVGAALAAGRSGEVPGHEPGTRPPTGSTEPTWGDYFEAIRRIGALPVFLPPERHDRYVAMISHLPFLLSAAFLVAVGDQEDWPEASELASSGFRDISRLGAGDPDMYAAIAGHNREQILRGWASMHEALDMFEAAMARGEEATLLELFRASRATREDWAQGHPDLA